MFERWGIDKTSIAVPGDLFNTMVMHVKISSEKGYIFEIPNTSFAFRFTTSIVFL